MDENVCCTCEYYTPDIISTLALFPCRSTYVLLVCCVVLCCAHPRYYPLNALTAVVAPIILFLSYTADVLRPELRTSGFGLVTASFSVS
jgi:hypothetical protein